MEPPAALIWKHNPVLPQPPGYYPGAINRTKHDYPYTSQNSWYYGVEFSVTETQILLIEGFEANFAESKIGALGGGSNCYVVITRGPISGKIDLLASGLEIHDVDSSAKALEWAAQKVQELKALHQSCSQEVDLWVGR